MQTDFQTELLKRMDAQDVKLCAIERGLYGDEKNRIRGLIDDMTDLKKWQSNISAKILFVSGVCTAICFSAKMFWEWMTKK